MAVLTKLRRVTLLLQDHLLKSLLVLPQGDGVAQFNPAGVDEIILLIISFFHLSDRLPHP